MITCPTLLNYAMGNVIFAVVIFGRLYRESYLYVTGCSEVGEGYERWGKGHKRDQF